MQNTLIHCWCDGLLVEILLISIFSGIDVEIYDWVTIFPQRSIIERFIDKILGKIFYFAQKFSSKIVLEPQLCWLVSCLTFIKEECKIQFYVQMPYWRQFSVENIDKNGTTYFSKKANNKTKLKIKSMINN